MQRRYNRSMQDVLKALDQIEGALTDRDTREAVKRLEKARKGLKRLLKDHGELAEQNLVLTRELEARRDQESRLQEAIKNAYETYRACFTTFQRFRQGMELVQTMRSPMQLGEVLERVRDNLELSRVEVVLAEEDFAAYVSSQVRTRPSAELRVMHKQALNLLDGRRIYIGPVSQLCNAGFFLGESFAPQEARRGSCVIFPLNDKFKDPSLVGFLTFHDDDEARYSSEKATDFLEHFCEIVANEIVTARDHERLDREKIVDELTGVHNRVYLYRHAQRILDFAVRKEFPVCCLFIDLDGFKQVNDTLGHSAGDALLVEVALTLKDIVRRYDIFVRLGGDEFVLIMPDTDVQLAEETRDRLRESIEQINVAEVAGQQTDIRVSGSIGLAVYRPGQTLDQLLGAADAQMYAHKNKRTATRSVVR